MIVELSIKDFAIIESLEIRFGRGLNIFTGETGAGKSIIMDAIALILGERASNETIRASSEEARVEALFDISEDKGGINGLLEDAGVPASDELIIKRVVNRSGRNRIYINGSIAPLATLEATGSRLIDICGQSEHQSLTRQDEHLELLDSFAGLDIDRWRMHESHGEYARLKKELEATEAASKDVSARRDLLLFQLGEIGDASLRPGEEDELKSRKELFQNSEKIKAVASQSEGELYSEPGSVVERLGAVIKALGEISRLDVRIGKTVEGLSSALYLAEDGAAFLRDYAESIEADPGELDSVASRLDLITRLKKKYGGGVEDILDRKRAMESELSGLEDLEERLAKTLAAMNGARLKAMEAASILNKKRNAAKKALEARVKKGLASLGMKDASFEVSIEADTAADGEARLTSRGSDKVSFMLSANKGEGPLKPLSRIASGGELSRIMLALKSASAGRVPTLIFDEVDTGVGGSIAQAVGARLKEVSFSNQVVCITHLPQVAAFADRHFSVVKAVKGGRTVTTVTELNEEERVEEISRMLGGLAVTDTTRKHARELIDAASAAKGLAKRPSGPKD